MGIPGLLLLWRGSHIGQDKLLHKETLVLAQPDTLNTGLQLLGPLDCFLGSPLAFFDQYFEGMMNLGTPLRLLSLQSLPKQKIELKINTFMLGKFA